MDTGEYTSTSEVAREALRVWKARRTVHDLEAEELRQLKLKSLNAGIPEMHGKRLRGKYGQQISPKRIGS